MSSFTVRFTQRSLCLSRSMPLIDALYFLVLVVGIAHMYSLVFDSQYEMYCSIEQDLERKNVLHHIYVHVDATLSCP